MNKKITLSVKDLELWFDNDYGAVKILNKISFDIYKGERSEEHTSELQSHA